MKSNSILGFVILGFSAFLAALGLIASQGFSLLASSSPPPADDLSVHIAIIVLGILPALAFIARSRKPLNRTVLNVLCCLSAAPLFAFGLFEHELRNVASVHFASLFCFGLSTGVLFSCWGGLWCKLYASFPKKLVFRTLCGSVLGGVSGTALALLAGSNAYFAAPLLSVASCLICSLCAESLGEAPVPGADAVEEDEFWGRKKYRSFVYGAFLGLLMTLAYARQSDNGFAYLAAVALGAALAITYSLVKKRIPEPNALDRLSSLTFVAFALLLLLAPEPHPLYVNSIAFIATIAMTTNFASHFSSSCTIVLRKQADPTKFLITLYFPVFFGLSLVLVLSLVVRHVLGAAWEIPIVAASTVMLATLSHVMLPYSDEESLAIFKYINDLETAAKKRASSPDETTLGRWRRACDALSCESSLTRRESEILLLMAKGRNVSYIADSLVISPHTAKTHIYHIYKKIGVSSHQELIDLVEGMSAKLEANQQGARRIG